MLIILCLLIQKYPHQSPTVHRTQTHDPLLQSHAKLQLHPPTHPQWNRKLHKTWSTRCYCGQLYLCLSLFLVALFFLVFKQLSHFRTHLKTQEIALFCPVLRFKIRLCMTALNLSLNFLEVKCSELSNQPFLHIVMLIFRKISFVKGFCKSFEKI